MPKYLSGRQKRRPQDKLTDDRYQYLGLDQAEPNLSDPLVGPSVPSGSQYQLVAVPGFPGKRFWVPVGGGLVPGAITIFDEDNPVSAASSVTQLNFVGAAVTANVSVQNPSGHPGIAATITVNPVTISDTPPTGARNGELWWESDSGDLFVYYVDADSAQWVLANAGGRGDTGEKGAKGDIGPQGLTGSTGQKGEVGQKGEKGAVEAQGNKGQKGDTGATGAKGQKGLAGDDGADGIKGLKGDGFADKIFEGNTEAEVVDTGSDGHFKVTTEGVERFRINNTGAVGIGTTNPENHLLELYTTPAAADWKFRIHTNVSDGAGFYQRANGDFELVLRDASNNNNYISGNGGGLEFVTSGTERLRINNVGTASFTGNVDIDGLSDLDDVNITGVTTFSEDVKFIGLNHDIIFNRSDNELEFRDNAKIGFGFGGSGVAADLVIQHNTNVSPPAS